jgi:hypothetical protein
LIIDAFLANDEEKLIQARMGYLINAVDLVFIGESIETFSGKPKPLNFQNLQDGNKVFHVSIPRIPSNSATINRWSREEFQRDYFLQEVQRLTKAEDIVLFCDVDEIPSIEQISEVSDLLAQNPNSLVNLVTPLFYRRLNWKVPSGEFWDKAKAFLSKSGVPGVRYKNSGLATNSSGAHFSYLGFGSESMKKKYSDFSHDELDIPAASDALLLNLADEFGVSHTGMFNSKDWGLLSPMDVGDLSEIQLYIYKTMPWTFGTVQFRKYTRMRRIAASRRISLAISHSNAKILIPKHPVLEIILAVHSMLAVLVFELGNKLLGAASRGVRNLFGASRGNQLGR